MKIAVTYLDGSVFQHFGHTEYFKIYTVENNAVIDSEVIETNGHGHGALASFLADKGVNVLICGGIGGGAQSALRMSGIKFYAGVSGSADDAVEDYLNGELDFDPNALCNHHGSHHHEDGHTCGDHGCGSHNCGSHGCK